MTLTLRPLLILITLAVLSACAPQGPTVTQAINPIYDAVQDGEYLIPAVPKEYLIKHNVRTEVAYNGPEAPGTIVVDVYSRWLYYVLPGGRATRYGIAVGREGLSFKGDGTIQRKAEWPSWQPTRNMVNSRPDLYAPYAAGLGGGIDNPLGARALYLYKGGRDTLFRIHGTIDPASIGRATSAGCIRLFNQDILDLYGKTDIGTPVHVRELEESRQLDGIWIDDEYGRIVQVPEGMTEEEALAHVAERRSKLELGVNAQMTNVQNPPPSVPGYAAPGSTGTNG